MSVVSICCFSISVCAFGQVKFGVIAGARTAEGYYPLPQSVEPFFSNRQSGSLVVGPTFELELSRHLSFEVDAIRQSARNIQVVPLLDGSSTYSYVSTSSNWQFPILAKYRFSFSEIKPFVEVGPSFLPSQSAQYGITGGVGVEINLGGLKLSPTGRYSCWADNQMRPALRNQVEFVVGVSKSSGSYSASVFGQRVSIGMIMGSGITGAFRSDTSYVQGTPVQTDLLERRMPIAGLALEVEPLKNLFLEVNGLYRPLHVANTKTSGPGQSVQLGEGFSVLTWQFPILAKYKWRTHYVKPFVELGAAFRVTGNLNGYDPSHVGFTSGAGLEVKLKRLKISPTVRYSHWRADSKQPGTISNQAELIVGFSF